MVSPISLYCCVRLPGMTTRNLRSTAITLTPKGYNAYVPWG